MRAQRRTTECPSCHKVFSKLVSQIRGRVTYCSFDCRVSAQIGMRGIPGSRTKIFTGTCQQCAGAIRGQRSIVARRKFCSRACQGRYLSGPRAPGWRGGIRTKRMALQNSPEYAVWRRAVLIRDGGRCRQCDARGVRMSADLEVHHIIPVGANWDLALDQGNGIALCHAHHIATLGRENEFAEFFAALVGAPLKSPPLPNRKDRMPLRATRDDLWQQYVMGKRSTPQIAKDYGVTPECVQKNLRRFGIPLRSPREASAVRRGAVA